MNVAVKLYQDVSDKPEGIPGLWPAETIELGESTQLPNGPWALMTCTEYQEYRRYHKAAYDSWYNIQQQESQTFVDP